MYTDSKYSHWNGNRVAPQPHEAMIELRNNGSSRIGDTARDPKTGRNIVLNREYSTEKEEYEALRFACEAGCTHFMRVSRPGVRFAILAHKR